MSAVVEELRKLNETMGKMGETMGKMGETMGKMGETMGKMGETMERMERLWLMSCKETLDTDEAALFTGYSKDHMYRLTSQRRIPHYKKEDSTRLQFRKSDLEDWMLADYVKTEEEIQNEAATYCVTGSMPRRKKKASNARSWKRAGK